MRVLVTGGSGFIGSNFIKYLLTDKEVDGKVSVVNLDKLTYAGKGRNIGHMDLHQDDRYVFIQGDIVNPDDVDYAFSKFSPDIVFNFAAESHVDRSIINAVPFIRSNIFGTEVLLQAAKRKGLERFVQISTDEVYGSLSPNAPSSTESDMLTPRSKYAASKAGAEHLVQSSHEEDGLSTVITRSSNNFGPYQFPEKLIPRAITNLIDGKPIPLMWSEENPGLNIRDWIHVQDNCRAIWYVSEYGNEGNVYNIGGGNEVANINLATIIALEFGFEDTEEAIQHVEHRTGHDFRYSLDCTKLKELGFEFRHQDFLEGLRQTIQWYRENQSWWRPLKQEAESTYQK